MSPKTKEQVEEIRTKRMVQIKEVALELFAHDGYHNTSISKIAKEASISKGLLYNYFKNKEALLETIIDDAADEIEQMMHDAIDASDNPTEQLRKIARISAKGIQADLRHWKLLTSLALQADVLKSREAELSGKVASMISSIVDVFSRMGAKNPLQEALFYGAVLDGIILHYMQAGDEYPLDEMIEYILNHFTKQ